MVLPSDLEQLATAPGVAAWVTRAVTRHLTAATRANGARPAFPLEVAHFLERLEAIATGTPTPGGAESGTPSRNLADVTGMKPVAAAAAEVGRDQSYVRRLVRQGRVRHHRAGSHGTLVDVDGLRSVINNSRKRAGG